MQTSMEVKYSIIIPHYNTADLLKKLLSTIPNSPEVQVIVIDDNSTKDVDKLRQVISDDNRSEFYTNTTGVQSAGACRNIGLVHAHGKWILFADSDDFFIEGFKDDLDSFYESPTDVIYFIPTSIDMISQNQTGRHILYEGLVNEYINRKSKKNEINLKYKFCCPVSKMIKRDLIQQNDIFFDVTPVSNDIMFSTKVGYYASSFEVSDKIIYCITKSSNTLTTVVREEYFDTRLDVLIRRYGFLKERISKNEIRKLDLSGHFLLFEALTKFGIKKFFKTVNLLKTNKIKLYSFSPFNVKMSAKALFDRFNDL